MHRSPYALGLEFLHLYSRFYGVKSPKGTSDSSPNTVHLRKCSMFGVEVISPGRGVEKLAQRVSAGKITDK
jgi:hypothetical protein